MKFTACKYLDFTNNYSAHKQPLVDTGKVCWRRPSCYEGAPEMVQFCRKRGRLNNPYHCTTNELARCDLYEDYEHDVPDAELEEAKNGRTNLTAGEHDQ